MRRGARRRPGPEHVPRAVPLRPADRSGRAPVSRSARARAPGPVRGARVGDLRAADRVRASGRDPAAADLSRWGAGASGRACATRRRAVVVAASRRRCWSRWSYPGRVRSRWCRAAREVVSGRVDLYGPDHERGWRRLRAIPGIGSWTVQKLALGGQGRIDQIPAGDLAYLKLVGRLLTRRPAGARNRGGGGGVLRALRTMGRAGRRLRAAQLEGDGLPAGAGESRGQVLVGVVAVSVKRRPSALTVTVRGTEGSTA